MRDTRDRMSGKATLSCTHYWMIGPHLGPTSSGVCRLCGAEKEFNNYLENQPAVLELKRDESGDHHYRYLVEA